MSEDEGLSDLNVAISVVTVVMEVASTNPSALNSYLKLVWTWSLNLFNFLYLVNRPYRFLGSGAQTVRRSLIPCNTDALISTGTVYSTMMKATVRQEMQFSKLFYRRSRDEPSKYFSGKAD